MGIILFVTLIIISIGFVFIASWGIKNIKSGIYSNLVLHAKLVGNYCIVPLTFEDHEQAREALSSLQYIDNIEFGCLYDKEGRLFACYPDTFSKTAYFEFPSQQNTTLKEEQFYVHETILFQNEKYGSIFLKANLKPVTDVRRAILLMLFVLTLVLTFLSTLLAGRMQRLISTPIISLKKHFDNIAKTQDFSARIIKQNNDEIGSLYDGFNNMLKQLNLKQDERDKAIESLGESEKYNRILFESSATGLALCRMDGSLVDINSAYAKIIGREVEETLKLSYWDITPEKFSKQEQEQLKSLEETGHYGPYEKEYTHKNGDLIPVSMSGIILVRDGEKYIWSSAEDISERKQMEKLLKESLENFQIVVSNVSVAVWSADIGENGAFENTYTSDVYDELLALPAGTGKSNWDKYLSYTKPEYLEGINKAFKKAIDTPDTTVEFEFEVVKANGQDAWFLSRGKCFDKDGKYHIVGSTADITERKRAENDRDKILFELELVNRVILKINQEPSIDAMAEILAKAIYEVNPGSHVAVSLYDAKTEGVQIKSIIGLDKNQEKIVKALGKDPRKIKFDPQKLDKVYCHYTSGELVHVNGGLAELMAGHVPKVQCRMAEKLMGLEAVYTVGFASNEMAKGGVVILLKKGQKINSSSAIETLVAQTSQVIQKKQAETEIKNLNENLEKIVQNRTVQLELANKELEAFSYSVSHDLKAPLRAVVGFSQILDEDFGSQLDPESKRYIGLIKANAENMGMLINDLLSFSRMGRADLQKNQIDLYAIAQRVKSELEAENQDRELTITIRPMPLINADEKLMYHVMQNLISNAVKFTGKTKNAIVELGCTSQNNKNVFYVKDNGIGFDMKYAGKIYDVFQRLHTVEEFPGTGIGLSIVQRILHKHEGSIWVESEKNKGTTFFFTV